MQQFVMALIAAVKSSQFKTIVLLLRDPFGSMYSRMMGMMKICLFFQKGTNPILKLGIHLMRK